MRRTAEEVEKLLSSYEETGEWPVELSQQMKSHYRIKTQVLASTNKNK
jgi:hypothetical protein